MHAVIHAADIQDRDGGVLVMATLFGLYPFLLKLYADGGYQGPQFKAALRRVFSQLNLEIVKRSDAAGTNTSSDGTALYSFVMSFSLPSRAQPDVRQTSRRLAG
jgi:hypothetical protein